MNNKPQTKHSFQVRKNPKIFYLLVLQRKYTMSSVLFILIKLSFCLNKGKDVQSNDLTLKLKIIIDVNKYFFLYQWKNVFTDTSLFKTNS